jgi:hypothetical protein
VGGGTNNTASGGGATVGGGGVNTASGSRATVPGGGFNVAAGDASFAAGFGAHANEPGTFVWADLSSGSDVFPSQGLNSFSVRASGGARFVNASGTGVQLAAGGNSWAPTSDRHAKEHFQAVDGRAILAALAGLPIETWNLRSQDPAIRHIGPMAQDFAVAFGLGEDDRHISTVDADGVAFAAIQGLSSLVQEQDAQLAAQQEHLAVLEEQETAYQQQVRALEQRNAALADELMAMKAEQAAQQQALEDRLAALEQAVRP